MNRKRFDLEKDYRPTGNKAMDGVASCILWHRLKKIALRAIFLKQPYYDWFRAGVELLQGKKLEEGQMMTFDSVNIEVGTRFQNEVILPQRWEDAN